MESTRSKLSQNIPLYNPTVAIVKKLRLIRKATAEFMEISEIDTDPLNRLIATVVFSCDFDSSL
jgi:hypothetical protein